MAQVYFYVEHASQNGKTFKQVKRAVPSETIAVRGECVHQESIQNSRTKLVRAEVLKLGPAFALARTMIGDDATTETKSSLRDIKDEIHQHHSLTPASEAVAREPAAETVDSSYELRQSPENAIEKQVLAARSTGGQGKVLSPSCAENATHRNEFKLLEEYGTLIAQEQGADDTDARSPPRQTLEGPPVNERLKPSHLSETVLSVSDGFDWKEKTEGSEKDDSCDPVSADQHQVPTQQTPASAVPRTTELLLERIQNERKRSQARGDVIQKLRSLKERSEKTKSTQESPPSLEGKQALCSIVSVESNDVSESYSSISTQTETIPVHTVTVDSSSSHFREAACFERNRANTFLVELAKAKAEILRLKFREAAMEKYNREHLHQDEKDLKDGLHDEGTTAGNECEAASLSSSWRSRFWKLGSSTRSTADVSQQETKSVGEKKPLAAPKSLESKSTDSGGIIEPSPPAARPRKAARASSSKNNRTIEENQALLLQLMQIMSSLSVRTDLSLQLDLKPSSQGWSLDSATVKRSDDE